MGSLSKRSPRRWSLEGLIPVCLSVARRAYASALRRKKKNRPTGDLGACAGSSRRCAGNAARGWQGATCWLSAERTSLMGGAWAVLLRSGPCVVDQLAGNSCDQKPRRGVWSKEQCRPHVVGGCCTCVMCPATNRRGPCHLVAVVVAVGRGRALPPLRSHP